MKRNDMKKYLVFYGCAIPALFLAVQTLGIGINGGGDRSAPYLYAPCVENINPGEKDTLTFRWKSGSAGIVSKWGLKIYKGYRTTEENLVMEKTIGWNRHSVDIPVKTFKKGQIYSWELYRISDSGIKSNRSFCSFSVAPAK